MTARKGDEMRGYSEPEKELICAAFAKAVGRALSNKDKSHLLVQLEDVAIDFQVRRMAMPDFPSPSKRREQLEALDQAIKRLSAAFAKMHPTVWHSISTRTELPEGPDRAIRQMLVDQTYDGETFTSHFGLEALHSGVRAALDELGERPRKKPGRNSNDSLHWFILRVADLFQELTGKEPRADYQEIVGKITSPFLKCLEACLLPIDHTQPAPITALTQDPSPAKKKYSLGDIANKLLEKRRAKRLPITTFEQG